MTTSLGTAAPKPELNEATQFARMAVEMAGHPDVEHTLDSIVDHALSTTVAEGAAILMITSGREIQPAGASDDLSRQADSLQMKCGEGPCLQSIWSHDTFVVTDTAEDQRWPQWANAIGELGWRSVLGVRLFTQDRTLGALNLFSRDVSAFDDDDVDIAEIFGRHASVALMNAREDGDLRLAISAKHLIGQAQGILMERYAIDADRAFAVLRRHSQDNNVKLRMVAQRVIATRRLPEA